jgi:glycosyltransferase involved in cell wall biosynthesis
MAGDGEEASNARAWCDQHGLRNRVSFPGYVEGADKAQLLVDSDIFVLASYHHEGCPNALLEAMGAGLPVIVSPAGGIPDVVRDGVNGIVVAPRDTDALEGALRKLIDNPDLRAEIARKNRAEAWEAFESRAVTVRLESHYRSLHSRTET